MRVATLCLVAGVACSAPPPPEPRAGCNPLIGVDCLTPFPSSFFQNRGAVAIPDGVLPVQEEEGPKVSLCHRTGAGFFVLISVGIAAEPAHIAHGDGKPGEAVPSQAGRFFTSTCGIR